MKKITTLLLVGLFITTGKFMLLAQETGTVGAEATIIRDVQNEQFMNTDIAGANRGLLEENTNNTFFRTRLLNHLGHPALEFNYNRYSSTTKFSDISMNNIYGGMLIPVPKVKNWFLKAVGTYYKRTAEEIYDERIEEFITEEISGSISLIGDISGFKIAAGMDYYDMNDDSKGPSNQLYSFRVKKDFGKLTLMAGASKETEAFERLGGGALYHLPYNFIVGGEVFSANYDEAYAFNIGRYTDKDDRSKPAFALNYLNIPEKFEWTNFRLTWGEPGISYVAPAFENPVFSGMHDINMALMMNELVTGNYRHFDSPLIYRRYDEYGKYTIRANFIKFPSGFGIFDINLSYSPNLTFAFLSRPHITFTYQKSGLPAIAMEPVQYGLDMGCYLFDDFYFGVIAVNDYEDYSYYRTELRYMYRFNRNK